LKLFHELSPAQQSSAIHHCASLLIEDIIRDGIEIEALDEDNKELFDKIKDAIEYIKKFDDDEAKTEYLMQDEDIRQAILDISLEMSRCGFYHSENDIVIFTEVLDEAIEEEEVAQEIEVIHTKKNKKKSLN
jgi:hypothetical protein